MSQVFETDWLASRPVFYNDKTGVASYNVNNVIDYDDVEIHPEGLINFLDFGYSILGQTPLRHVKILPHSSRLAVQDDGTLKIDRLHDPTADWIGKTLHEDDAWHALEQSIRQWERSLDGEIVVPTSGGFDSRLLNYFIQDKTRIRSFTYGLSTRQAESDEAVYAEELSKILGTRWERIELGDFHRYLHTWDDLFGLSIHAHGMYQLEFYNKLRSRVAGGNPVLSGIFGDVFAGKTAYQPLRSPADLRTIGYTHGLHADCSQSILISAFDLREQFWKEHEAELIHPSYQIVWLIRLKIILISYLLTVPRHLGYRPWSPYPTPEVALAMLAISPERRKDRLWQREFFAARGLDLEHLPLKSARENVLDRIALKRVPLRPLDVELLSEIVNPRYVEWINNHISYSAASMLRVRAIHVRTVGNILRRIGVREDDAQMKAYSAYMTLRPLESIIKRRNAKYRGHSVHAAAGHEIDAV